jgi:hypothetical protein
VAIEGRLAVVGRLPGRAHCATKRSAATARVRDKRPPTIDIEAIAQRSEDETEKRPVGCLSDGERVVYDPTCSFTERGRVLENAA